MGLLLPFRFMKDILFHMLSDVLIALVRFFILAEAGASMADSMLLGRDITDFFVMLLGKSKKYPVTTSGDRARVNEMKETLGFCSLNVESDTKVAEYEAKLAASGKSTQGNYQRTIPPSPLSHIHLLMSPLLSQRQAI